jgi:hypothetical protein
MFSKCSHGELRIGATTPTATTLRAALCRKKRLEP